MWAHLRTYIEAGTEPPDLYQLVGARLLDPQHDTLVQRSRDASRFLIGFQNHQNPDFVLRARRLQMQVARASDIFSDARRLHDYETQICDDLRHRYSASNGNDPARWRTLDLQRWLGVTCNVHPARIDFAAREMIKAAASALPTNAEQAVAGQQRPSFRSTAFADVVSSDSPVEVRPTRQGSRDDAVRRAPESQEEEEKPIEPGEHSSSRPPAFQRPVRHSRRSANAMARQVKQSNTHANGPGEIMWIIGAAVVTVILVIVIAAIVLVPRIVNGAGAQLPQSAQNDTASSLDKFARLNSRRATVKLRHSTP